MAYIFTLIWGLILANVVGYVVRAMTPYTYDAQIVAIFGLFFAILVVLVGTIMGGQKPSESHH